MTEKQTAEYRFSMVMGSIFVMGGLAISRREFSKAETAFLIMCGFLLLAKALWLSNFAKTDKEEE